MKDQKSEKNVSENEEVNNEQKPVEMQKSFSPARLFFGLIILLIGIVYLLNNAGITHININFNFNLLWPIILIGIGLSLLSRKSWITWVLVLVFILIMLGIAFPTFINQNSETTNHNEDISISKESKATSAEINIKTGAGDLKINGNAFALVSGKFSSDVLTLQKNIEMDGSVEKIDFETSDKNIFIFSKNKTFPEP